MDLWIIQMLLTRSNNKLAKKKYFCVVLLPNIISYMLVWFMALAMRFPAVFGNISFELISCSAFALRLSVALAFFSLLFIYLFIILLFQFSLLELELHLEFVSNLCANWNSMDCGQLNGFASPLGNPVLVSLPPFSLSSRCLSVFLFLLTTITMQNWQCLPTAYK